MDRLLNRIQWVRPAAFCSREFFLLHHNAPAHKAASVSQFLNHKNVTTLYHPPYSPDLSPPDYFLFPKMKMKLKGLHFADVAEIQEAVTDKLKKVQKEELSTASQNCTTAQKLYMRQWNLFGIKKKACVFMSLRFKKKKIVLKLLDGTVYWTSRQFLSGTPYHGHISFHVTYHREKRIDLLTFVRNASRAETAQPVQLLSSASQALYLPTTSPPRLFHTGLQSSGMSRYMSCKIEFGEWIPVRLTILNIHHTKQSTQIIRVLVGKE